MHSASTSQHKHDCHTMQVARLLTRAMIQQLYINISTDLGQGGEGGGKGEWPGGVADHLYFSSITASDYATMLFFLLLVQLTLSLNDDLLCCLIITAACRKH